VAEERNEDTRQCSATTASGEQCRRYTTGEFCGTHENTQDRTNREQDSRKSEARPTDAWTPPSQLPMPNPQAGWVFRYIRTASLDKADTKNVSRRFREGWEPVNAGDYPELEITSDIDSRWPDGVEVGGLLLCKIPQETVDSRKKYYKDFNDKQLRSVDEGFMNDQDPRMPKYNESTSRTSFRKG
jgi:hypothetical protein